MRTARQRDAARKLKKGERGPKRNATAVVAVQPTMVHGSLLQTVTSPTDRTDVGALSSYQTAIACAQAVRMASRGGGGGGARSWALRQSA